MPYEDVDRNGKTYRTIWEEINIGHPEGPKILVVELKKPGHKVVWEYTGTTNNDLAWMRAEARKEIEKL